MLSENQGTFHPNPNSNTEPWIEHRAFEDLQFRIWHIILIGATTFIAFVVLICCCIKIRIPRTKQEIEADYRRKQLTDKFQQRLKLIKNQDMDLLDLKAALDIIREDYRSEAASTAQNIHPVQSILQLEHDNDDSSGLYTTQLMQAASQEVSFCPPVLAGPTRALYPTQTYIH